jgi:hypothetical protein
LPTVLRDGEIIFRGGKIVSFFCGERVRGSKGGGKEEKFLRDCVAGFLMCGLADFVVGRGAKI